MLVDVDILMMNEITSNILYPYSNSCFNDFTLSIPNLNNVGK